MTQPTTTASHRERSGNPDEGQNAGGRPNPVLGLRPQAWRIGPHIRGRFAAVRLPLMGSRSIAVVRCQLTAPLPIHHRAGIPFFEQVFRAGVKVRASLRLPGLDLFGVALDEPATGPGTSLGGIEWGSAYDGKRIYTPEANPDTTGGPPNTYNLFGGGTATGGSWAALNPQTGAFDWQTAVPGSYAALGPVSEANGVLYGASWTPAPRIRTCSRWTRAPARSCGALRPGHR